MAIEHIRPPDLMQSKPLGLNRMTPSPAGKQVFASGQVPWTEDMQICGEGEIGVQALVTPGLRIEIEATALVPDGR